MNFLFFGDIYGRPGREAVKQAMTEFRARNSIDFIVVNGENMSHGNGIQPEMAEEFFSLGVDVITLGNHAWDQKAVIPYIEKQPRLLRPLNYPNEPEWKAPGSGSVVVESRHRPGLKLGVIQLMGRVFMDALDCPFRAAEAEVKKMKEQGVRSILVDFHGEASSEKQSMAYFLEGKVSAVLGTHAHVQTADERVLPGGTAAITDVGMCGCFDSVIGVKKEIVIQKFLTKRPIKFEPAEGPGGYGCVLVDVDESTGRARSIQRFRKELA